MDRVEVLQVAADGMTFEKLLSPLLDALKTEGFAVGAAFSGAKSRFPRLEGCQIHNIPFERRALSSAHFRSLWLLYKLLKESSYSIIHAHTAIASVIARIAAKSARTRVVIYTAHGFYLRDDMSLLIRAAVIAIEWLLGRFATDWMFVQSEQDTALAKKYGFMKDKNRIVCIGNGVAIDSFCKEHHKEDIRASLGIPDGDKVIGFVGRLVREKGLMELVEAFREINRGNKATWLLIVGETLPSDRDSAFGETLKRYIGCDDWGNRVIFTGFRDDIPEIMSIMDVFVLPSHREGLPRTIIEAMASGKPVVATDISGCREEVVVGETGFLVPVKNPQSLAYSIGQILDNPSLAERMGLAGRRRAIEKYDEKRVIEKQLAIYKEIASSI